MGLYTSSIGHCPWRGQSLLRGLLTLPIRPGREPARPSTSSCSVWLSNYSCSVVFPKLPARGRSDHAYRGMFHMPGTKCQTLQQYLSYTAPWIFKCGFEMSLISQCFTQQSNKTWLKAAWGHTLLLKQRLLLFLCFFGIASVSPRTFWVTLLTVPSCPRCLL